MSQAESESTFIKGKDLCNSNKWLWERWPNLKCQTAALGMKLDDCAWDEAITGALSMVR